MEQYTMIYKKSSSKYYWCMFRVVGSKNKFIRRSTRTTDKNKAKIIEQTLKLAMHRAAPAESLHSVIDMLLGIEQQPQQHGLPLEALQIEYERVSASVGRVVSHKTLTDRARAVRRLIEWRDSVRPDIKTIEEMNAISIRMFASDLARMNLSTKTRKNILSDLITVLKTLGYPINIWQGIMPTDTDSEIREAFTVEQEQRVLEAAKIVGNCWYEMSLLSRHTGLRKGDVIALTDENINKDTHSIVIVPNKTKKHKIKVVIPLPEKVWNELEQILTRSGQIFCDHNPLPHDKSIQFAKVLEVAGVEGNYTFHSWRHTFRTRLSEAGISDDIAMRLGGWTQSSTAARYDHAERIEELRAAVEAATNK